MKSCKLITLALVSLGAISCSGGNSKESFSSIDESSLDSSISINSNGDSSSLTSSELVSSSETIVEPSVEPVVTSESLVETSEDSLISSEEFDSGPIEEGYIPSQKEIDVLGEYNKLFREAASIKDISKKKERMEKLAKAEINLLYDTSAILPWYSGNSKEPKLSRIIPYTKGKIAYGIHEYRLKNVISSQNNITKENFDNLSFIYEEAKAKYKEPTIVDGWISLDNQFENEELKEGVYEISSLDQSKNVSIETKNTLNLSYSKNISRDCLNYLTNTFKNNYEHYVNLVDGLVEFDIYGNIVGALADKYKVGIEGDKQTFTFRLKKANWVDNSSGEIKANVVADDFLASIEYILDPANNSSYLEFVKHYISNVEVVDEETIKFILNEPTPCFLSLLTNSCFLPVNRAYLKSQGTNFGKTANNILVNGPFRVSSYEDNSHITYIKNENYYDAKHVYLDVVNKIMLSSSTKKATLRKYFEENKLDEAIISSEDKEGWETYISGPEGKGSLDFPYSNELYVDKKYENSTYFGVFNFNRRYFEYSEEDLKKTEHEKELTNLALMNKSFRQAFVRGLNVTEYLKKYNKEDPTVLLYRGFTSRGTDVYACKDYADYVDEEYNSINNLEGEEAITLTGINQGYDPIFDEEKSKELYIANS